MFVRDTPSPDVQTRALAEPRLAQSSISVTLFPVTELADGRPQGPAQVSEQPDALPLGARSLIWRYFGDSRMVLIGPRPGVLQLMLAELGQGVLDHSVFFADTAARIKRSLPPIYRTVYGSADDNTGTQVRDFHHDIKGELPAEHAGGEARRYHALDPDTYFWAHATFLDQVFYFADTFVKRLTDAEKEQMYAESKTWYRRYGVSDRAMPATYADFEKYWQRMLDEVVIAHPSAAYSVGYVTKGFPRPKGVSPLLWAVLSRVFNPLAAFVTTGGLPPQARRTLGLPWTAKQERRYQRFAGFSRSGTVNWVWNRLPMSLRYNTIAQAGFAREGVTP